MAVVYAVFRSRGQALRFTAALCGCGVQADTASAPQEAHIGCALAARFCPQRLPLLFPKSSSILFGSPVKATKWRDLV